MIIHQRWMVFAAVLGLAVGSRADIKSVVSTGGGSISLTGFDIGPGGTRVEHDGGASFTYPASSSASRSVGSASGASGGVSISFSNSPTVVSLSFSGEAGPSSPNPIEPNTSGSYSVSAAESFTLPLDCDVSIQFIDGGASSVGESVSGGPGNTFSLTPHFNFSFFPPEDDETVHLLAGNYTISGGSSGGASGNFNGGNASGGSGTVSLTVDQEFVPEPAISGLLGLPMLMLRRRRR
jgi:hypothetical protein